MPKEFILEDEIVKIINPRTKSYMEEVISSYNMGNYKSAIVVLYSVLIYDLRAKLLTLSNIYKDEKALKLVEALKGMDECADKDPHNMPYSKIENYLLDEIKKTPLLSSIEYGKVENLKRLRNICAHPVILNDYTLAMPHKDEVRSAIRDCIENVFKREPLLAKNLINEILEESKEFFEKFELTNLKEYLTKKFYKKMTLQSKEKVFYELWKMCFVVNNEECNETRKSTYHALMHLVDSDIEHFRKLAKTDYYSKLRVPDIPTILNVEGFENYNASYYNSGWSALVFFLSVYPFFYDVLPEYIKTAMQEFCKNNVRHLTLSYYTSETIDDHLKKIEDKLESIPHPSIGFKSSFLEPKSEDLNVLLDVAKEKDCEELVRRFILKRAMNPASYSISAHYYGFIEKNRNVFTNEEYKDFAFHAYRHGQTDPEVKSKLNSYIYEENDLSKEFQEFHSNN